jgi:hypothetical protein
LTTRDNRLGISIISRAVHYSALNCLHQRSRALPRRDARQQPALDSRSCHQAARCLLFVLMGKTLEPTRTSPDIFERLANHGILDYEGVKTIVSLQIPQAAYFFVQQFGQRTLADVLRQIERWKGFLKTDFLLPASERAEVIRRINQTQLLARNALIQANSPRIGDWEMRYGWIPTGQDESGNSVYIRPALGITARHRETGEIRRTSIPHELADASDLEPSPIIRAFKELGLWEHAEKGSLRRYLVSSRKAQGWPMYTQLIIPQLYEFLAPHYPNRGHHSEKRDRAMEERQALFPKDLLEDMLDILRMENPHVFGQTTINQLKASIQRHLARKTKSIKSPL